MRSEQNLEQIFSRQEQAIVYLFSRYWERIPEFKTKKIIRIHTHFPDFSISNAAGESEAIEFEYGLCAFRSHLHGTSLKNLWDEGVRKLYIVYWEHNDDKDDLRAEVRRRARFNVDFVCLRDWFQAEVRKIPGADGLGAFWRFTQRRGRSPKKAYSLSAIVGAMEKVKSSIDEFDVRKGLYRVIGFNTSGAEFIDCDHLEQIHFFTTTTRFARDRIPSRLFMKSTGCRYFNGYFDIRAAFQIVQKNKNRSWKTFVADYYFERWARYIGEEKCFVGSFTGLPYDKGKAIYDALEKGGYRLGIRGSIAIEKAAVVDRIDAIIGRRNRTR